MKPAIIFALLFFATISFGQNTGSALKATPINEPAQDKPKPIELDPLKLQKRFETLQEEKKKADEMIVYWTTRSNTLAGQMAELQNVVLDKNLAPPDSTKKRTK